MINFFNFKLNNNINESIVFIRLKKEEMNRKNIKKLKNIRKKTKALIIEFENLDDENIFVAKEISDRCLFGETNHENENLRTNIALFGKIFEYD